MEKLKFFLEEEKNIMQAMKTLTVCDMMRKMVK